MFKEVAAIFCCYRCRWQESCGAGDFTHFHLAYFSCFELLSQRARYRVLEAKEEATLVMRGTVSCLFFVFLLTRLSRAAGL